MSYLLCAWLLTTLPADLPGGALAIEPTVAPLATAPLSTQVSPPTTDRWKLWPATITAVDEEKFLLTVKSKGKTVEVYYGKAMREKHSVKKLVDLKDGVPMTAFGRVTHMTSTRDYLEQLVVMVAGYFTPPEYRVASIQKAHWQKGPLRFRDEKNTMMLGDYYLHCGKSRPVCVINAAKITDYYETKNGKIKGKKIFLVGIPKTEKVDGKKVTKFDARRIILPTKGIPKKEYGYILEPWRLNDEQRKGKR